MGVRGPTAFHTSLTIFLDNSQLGCNTLDPSTGITLALATATELTAHKELTADSDTWLQGTEKLGQGFNCTSGDTILGSSEADAGGT